MRRTVTAPPTPLTLCAALALAVGAVSCGGDDAEVGLANPASEYCIAQGGELRIVTAEDGGQTGICRLPDGRDVEEWAFYRSQTSSTVDTTTPEAPESFEVFLLADGDDCDVVVGRPHVSSVEGTLGEAVSILLAGPSAEDTAAGLHSWFSPATADLLHSVRVEDGVATVSFDPALRELVPNASSSCGSAGLLAQLDATVLQFDGVEDARYALGGDVAAFYEWLQMTPPS